jgi:hypothetical protein
LLIFVLSALIVLTLKSFNYGCDWMFASETRAIAVAIEELMQSPGLPTVSPETTSSPLQQNEPLITMHYTSNNRRDSIFWSGCTLWVHLSRSRSYNTAITAISSVE